MRARVALWSAGSGTTTLLFERKQGRSPPPRGLGQRDGIPQTFVLLCQAVDLRADFAPRLDQAQVLSCEGCLQPGMSGAATPFCFIKVLQEPCEPVRTCRRKSGNVRPIRTSRSANGFGSFTPQGAPPSFRREHLETLSRHCLGSRDGSRLWRPREKAQADRKVCTRTHRVAPPRSPAFASVSTG
ncbi:hypothetical protein FHX15_005461 [Rhizobium sp. BK650]|nr:hypothetical protein [Rhizobium sp. BK650]